MTDGIKVVLVTGTLENIDITIGMVTDIDTDMGITNGMDTGASIGIIQVTGMLKLILTRSFPHQNLE